MTLRFAVQVQIPFAEAVRRTKNALTAQGFGVLTEIDVRATLHNKLGVDIEDYLILGACNPPLAHRALTVDRRIGLLLPCNVVIRSSNTHTIIEAIDPRLMAHLTDNPGFDTIADQAAQRLDGALTTVAVPELTEE